MSRTHQLWLKTIAALLLLFLGVTLLGFYFRSPLESAGQWFVGRFGYWGMAVGSFLADAFHVPVPLQAYLLAAILSGKSQVIALLAIGTGSILGGALAYVLGRKFASARFLQKWLEPLRPDIDQMVLRHGYLTVFVGALTPLAFGSQCILAGLYGFPLRLLSLILLLRIPRVLLFYVLLREGWKITA